VNSGKVLFYMDWMCKKAYREKESCGSVTEPIISFIDDKINIM